MRMCDKSRTAHCADVTSAMVTATNFESFESLESLEKSAATEALCFMIKPAWA